MGESTGGRPQLRWLTHVRWPAVLATAAGGAAIVAFFVVPAGSLVAAVVVILATGLLATAALVAGSRSPAAVHRRAGARLPATTPRAAEEIGRALAKEVTERLEAPAAAVLVPRDNRLVAAGSVGDWALVRRWLARWEAERSSGANLPPGVVSPSGAADDASPPELPLDDFLPRLLGIYPRAVPFERWRDLSDAPVALLPLVALADRGAAVAVAVRHRGRLAGLCVIARRPNGKPYTDEELRLLERLASQAGASLAAALRRQ